MKYLIKAFKSRIFRIIYSTFDQNIQQIMSDHQVEEADKMKP